MARAHVGTIQILRLLYITNLIITQISHAKFASEGGFIDPETCHVWLEATKRTCCCVLYPGEAYHVLYRPLREMRRNRETSDTIVGQEVARPSSNLNNSLS